MVSSIYDSQTTSSKCILPVNAEPPSHLVIEMPALSPTMV